MTESHIYSDNFTEILNNLFHGVFLLDKNGVVLEFNKATLKMLSVTALQVKGAKLDKFVPEKYMLSFDEYFLNCQNELTKNYGKFEIQIPSLEENTKVLEFDLNQNFISDEDGERYTIGLINDVTKRKELEKEIELQKKSKDLILEKLEKEQELNDMKSRFISIASHEFRTPLAGILSSVDLIERYLVADKKNWSSFIHNEKVEKHLGKVKTSIKNLTVILNQFLSLGKLEEGKTTYYPEKFNLQEMCLEHTNEFKYMLKKNQKLEYRHQTNAVDVWLDKNILRNILNNLLSNSVKYTPENKSIFLDSFIDDKKIQIIIKDEGYGIPENEQKNLFRRFFRAKNVENLQGTGLGLTIVKRYVELMNGEIKFESIENVGTSFCITFYKVSEEKK